MSLSPALLGFGWWPQVVAALAAAVLAWLLIVRPLGDALAGRDVQRA